jgi:hypothetical protein
MDYGVILDGVQTMLQLHGVHGLGWSLGFGEIVLVVFLDSIRYREQSSTVIGDVTHKNQNRSGSFKITSV